MLLIQLVVFSVCSVCQSYTIIHVEQHIHVHHVHVHVHCKCYRKALFFVYIQYMYVCILLVMSCIQANNVIQSQCLLVQGMLVQGILSNSLLCTVYNVHVVLECSVNNIATLVRKFFFIVSWHVVLFFFSVDAQKDLMILEDSTKEVSQFLSVRDQLLFYYTVDAGC